MVIGTSSTAHCLAGRLSPRHHYRAPDQADEPTSILILSAPGELRGHRFEGMARLGDMPDEERRE